ncbi:MAG: mechanosensitive ion channel [Alphaproteobacteria bacterium]|nr:MAG: mechanosensitive ion channel [Alphaproteobacteria bacterium]
MARGGAVAAHGDRAEPAALDRHHIRLCRRDRGDYARAHLAGLRSAEDRIDRRRAFRRHRLFRSPHERQRYAGIPGLRSILIRLDGGGANDASPFGHLALDQRPQPRHWRRAPLGAHPRHAHCARVRVLIKLGVGYESDPDAVRDILLDIARSHPQVVQAPPPAAFLVGFGESALEFELRAIVADVEKALSVRSDINHAILRRLRAAGIEIPFPQRELRWREAALSDKARAS